MAGAEGFEPSHGGFRVHSLTAWLCPNVLIHFTHEHKECQEKIHKATRIGRGRFDKMKC